MSMDPKVAKSRRMLLVLAAVFLLPLLAAFVLYYGSSWRPSGSTAHGVLMQPAQPLPRKSVARAQPPVPSSSAAVAPANTAAAAVSFEKLWSLVVIGDGRCDQACRDTLYFARQEQRMLGHLGTRLQRVWLATGECCDWQYLNAEQADLQAVSAADAALAPLLAAFPDADRAHMVYIVDPLGNLVMRYDARQPPNGLRDDLKKLLDLSHVG